MRWGLCFLLLTVVSGAATAQSDSVAKRGNGRCWRGRPQPVCHSFWITEVSAEYPYATTSTHYTFTYPTFTQSYSRRDVTPQFFVTIGPMFNTGPSRALGVTASAGAVHDGSRLAVEARRRYWAGQQGALDLSAGIVRMNVPPLTISDQVARGLTAGAYALDGDLVHVNARADLLFGGGRTRAGASVGAGVGSYAALGTSALFVVLVGGLIIVLARGGGDF